MNKTLLTTIAAAMIASVAVPAMAAQQGQGHGPRIERLMQQFDANSDGAITQDEISAQRAEMFKSADADNSGTLSAEEFGFIRDMRQKQREERIAARQEMGEDMRKQRGMEGKGEMRGQRDGKHRGQKFGQRDGMRGDGPQIERLDTDNDGQVSLAEFSANDSRLFARFDRNGDNKIDATDFSRKPAGKN